MKTWRLKLAAVSAAVVLAACGGGGGAGDQNPRVAFTGMVTFGDSLSDIGTYKVGTVAAIGGGQFTVNGPGPLNWTEHLAADIKVSPLCPAQTGLLPNIPGFTGGAVTNHAECTSYAQGSSRVSNVFGPNAAALQAAPFSQVTLGLMAVPVATQMATHLSKSGGAYKGTELVTVLAGGNDVFMHLNGVSSAAAGGAGAVGAAVIAGWSSGVQASVAAGGAAAVNAAATAAVQGMGAAGAELAGLIKTQVVGKGAKYVVVVNLPDVSQTPFAMPLDAGTRGLINTMVTTFNAQLSAGLAGSGVVLVDAYTQGRDQVANPAQYGLSNVTSPACSATSPANPLGGSSLTCTAASTVTADVSQYLYADTVHITPRGNHLLSHYVAIQMAKAGWL